MSTLFVDTSALAKRYLGEIGSTWLRHVVRRAAGNTVVISSITTLELPALLARRVREGTLSVGDAGRIERTFLRHASRDYLRIPVGGRVLVQARALVARHPLRTLDAIQLASLLVAARTLGPVDTFLSSDRQLLVMAAAEGLVTDDPERHP